MPIKIYDFECPRCKAVFEDFAEISETEKVCQHCNRGVWANRIISRGKVYSGNESPTWLKDTLEVVDRENKAPHVQEFVKNPTRTTYKNWMRGEGIKPVDYTEHGGPPTYKKPQLDRYDRERITRDIYEKHRSRKMINVIS